MCNFTMPLTASPTLAQRYYPSKTYRTATHLFCWIEKTHESPRKGIELIMQKQGDFNSCFNINIVSLQDLM